MKIDSHQMMMSSSRVYQEVNEFKSSLTVITAPPAESAAGGSAQKVLKGNSGEKCKASRSSATSDSKTELSADEFKTLVLKTLLEKLFNVKFDLKNLGKQLSRKTSKIQEGLQNRLAALHTGDSGKGETASNPPKQGWASIYEESHTRIETEDVAFSVRGTVNTSDGKSIDISIDLEISRTLQQHSNIQILDGDIELIDPLVINFNRPSAELSQTKFEFDLTGDGKPNLISAPVSGSGFLALDRNNDGVINNGKELFGPDSGNGFEELAAYDDDGNGWIDSGDAAYSELKVWTRDDQGNDHLYALADLGIGALYLQSIDTLFSLKDNGGELDGVIRSTGVFLREDGRAGTIQHVDLAG